MFFLSIPQAWHLVGTWSEQLPSEANLIGMGQTELMMTLHSIFVPLLLVISYYIFNRLNKNESKKIKGCCLLYTSPSPRDLSTSRMPSSA